VFETQAYDKYVVFAKDLAKAYMKLRLVTGSTVTKSLNTDDADILVFHKDGTWEAHEGEGLIKTQVYGTFGPQVAAALDEAISCRIFIFNLEFETNYIAHIVAENKYRAVEILFEEYTSDMGKYYPDGEGIPKPFVADIAGGPILTEA